MTPTDATSACAILFLQSQKIHEYQTPADPRRILFVYEPFIDSEASSTQAKIDNLRKLEVWNYILA
ncbi:hypothetical protein BOTNAR_0354g00040 [Botryotinia narcissicola]|uniref:Uncharacterized protein n=1 Tax=Botryotinia narcissicola TaxID=278944 RepID=A0A4Z1I3F4_9HELO|nr:hypothetical protein BOTNAR_0354g00040 [Botryotinia narcissicola]